jgi:hypothetical protein
MPKYIKLFENFISEAAPYALDPTNTTLTGAKLYTDSMYYAIYKSGRAYVAVKNNNSVTKAPGNLIVTLDSKNPTIEKALAELGGKMDPKASGELSEPSGGVYKHFAKFYFTLGDTTTGNALISKVVNVLNGETQSSSGTAGTAGTADAANSTGKNLADSVFGGTTTLSNGTTVKIADLFRQKIAADGGGLAKSYSGKLEAANKRLLSSNPEYVALTKKLDSILKSGKIDTNTGKNKSGEVDKDYMELTKKMNDLLSKEINL